MNCSRETSEPAPSFGFRHSLRDQDADWVRGVVQRAGVFSASEIEIAVELVRERLAQGPASGYYFLFAEQNDAPVAYACYGPIPATAYSYDLYWIVVDPICQNNGVGRALLAETQRLIEAAGGRRVYAETSSRDPYRAARAFYERRGFHREATLRDFYADGDDKVIYAKRLQTPAET